MKDMILVTALAILILVLFVWYYGKYKENKGREQGEKQGRMENIGRPMSEEDLPRGEVFVVKSIDEKYTNNDFETHVVYLEYKNPFGDVIIVRLNNGIVKDLKVNDYLAINQKGKITTVPSRNNKV